jgi:hypothetical protein
MTTKRVTVITQGGKLVGVYVPPEPPRDPKAPVPVLVAGPRQKRVEAMLEVPAVLKGSKHVEALHAAVRKKLKLRK